MSAALCTEALRQLRQIIEQERGAILGNDAQGLNQAMAAKAAPLQAVQGLLSMLHQGRDPGNLAAEKAELVRLVRECEEANRANAALLHLKAARARKLLAPLETALGLGPAAAYGARKPAYPRPGGGGAMISTLRARA